MWKYKRVLVAFILVALLALLGATVYLDPAYRAGLSWYAGLIRPQRMLTKRGTMIPYGISSETKDWISISGVVINAPQENTQTKTLTIVIAVPLDKDKSKVFTLNAKENNGGVMGTTAPNGVFGNQETWTIQPSSLLQKNIKVGDQIVARSLDKTMIRQNNKLRSFSAVPIDSLHFGEYQ